VTPRLRAFYTTEQWGSFERFKTKTYFNSFKRLVGVTAPGALGALAVKLLAIALATAAGDGTPLDLLVRVPASLADLGAALLVFAVLRTRRPLQLAARSAILVAVSPVLFVASGIHGDLLGVAVALLLLAMCLLVDRDAPLVAGITLAVASRVEPAGPGAAAGSGAAGVGSGAAGVGSGAVDHRAHPPPEVGYAPPPGDPTTAGRGEVRPAGRGELFRLGDRGYASPREQVRRWWTLGPASRPSPGCRRPASAGSGAASGRSPWSACGSPSGCPTAGPRAASWW
jgi:hypothetical protein